VVANELAGPTAQNQFSIILITIAPPSASHKNQWFPASDVLAKVASSARGALRGADLLFHFSAKELAILLLRTDRSLARQIADRVAKRVNGVAENEFGTAVEVLVGVASAPDDGLSLEALVRVAESQDRGGITSNDTPSSIH
jgi:hypothetical protein